MSAPEWDEGGPFSVSGRSAGARGYAHLSHGMHGPNPRPQATVGVPPGFRLIFWPCRCHQAQGPSHTTLKGASVLHSPVRQLAMSWWVPAAMFTARLRPRSALNHTGRFSCTGFPSPRHSRRVCTPGFFGGAR
ncbi:hypothetical protein NDU88_007908 [Pleurodeles waltl]|uniref:Uncharacterized protein n=1 Tax=Pleurodeles waltl TaxID=8319 RepID=A0AAV7NUE7_PLEWA|nr:hypothetical protein NDU88_007908 [Pleurodeles waltl]